MPRCTLCRTAAAAATGWRQATCCGSYSVTSCKARRWAPWWRRLSPRSPTRTATRTSTRCLSFDSRLPFSCASRLALLRLASQPNPHDKDIDQVPTFVFLVMDSRMTVQPNQHGNKGVTRCSVDVQLKHQRQRSACDSTCSACDSTCLAATLVGQKVHQRVKHAGSCRQQIGSPSMTHPMAHCCDCAPVQVNRIRQSLSLIARNSTAFGLVQPHLERTKLCQLADSALDQHYVAQRAELQQLVTSLAHPKVGYKSLKFLPPLSPTLQNGKILRGAGPALHGPAGRAAAAPHQPGAPQGGACLLVLVCLFVCWHLSPCHNPSTPLVPAPWHCLPPRTLGAFQCQAG